MMLFVFLQYGSLLSKSVSQTFNGQFTSAVGDDGL